MITANVDRNIIAYVETLVRGYGYQISECWNDLVEGKYVFMCEFRAEENKPDKKRVAFSSYALAESWEGKNDLILNEIKEVFSGCDRYQYFPYTEIGTVRDWSKVTWQKRLSAVVESEK